LKEMLSRLQTTAAAGKPLAEKIHPSFEWHRQPTTDERLQLLVAFRSERRQGPSPGSGTLA
jgi:hypothetical protein